MKKLFTFIYILLVGSLFSFGQNIQENFLNWHISEYNSSKILHTHISQWTQEEVKLLFSENSPYNEELKVFLTEDNLSDLKVQLEENQAVTWDKDLLKTLGVKGVKTKVEKVDFESAFWSYSTPIISEEQGVCIMKVDFVCGATCHTSKIVVFLKDENGSWSEVLNVTPVQEELLSSY